MRKVLFFVAFIFCVAQINAQTVTSTIDAYVPLSTGYGYYTGVASDTINGVATMDAVFFVNLAAKSRYTFSYMIDGDTLNGCAGNATIQPQGSYDGVTYTSVGSSVTWTTTANYLANVSQNTYTTLASGTITNASHTRTTAAFNVLQDTSLASSTHMYVDSIEVPAQTQTVAAQISTDARTVTVTLPGCDYRYIKLLITGASSARCELQLAALKVTPVSVSAGY